VEPVDERDVVGEDNGNDGIEFDVLAQLEFEEEEEIVEVKEADVVRELQGKAAKCHPARDPESMDFEGVVQTVVAFANHLIGRLRDHDPITKRKSSSIPYDRNFIISHLLKWRKSFK
jgi:hypothetical protein